MNRVNLLPWRQKARQRLRKKRTILSLCLVCCFITVFVLIHRVTKTGWTALSLQRVLLQQTLALQQKMLQQQRDLAVQRTHSHVKLLPHSMTILQHFWLKLTTILPHFVWLNTVQQSANQLIVLGSAYSFDGFERFRLALLTELSPQPICRLQIQQQATQLYHFKLHIVFAPDRCRQVQEGDSEWGNREVQTAS